MANGCWRWSTYEPQATPEGAGERRSQLAYTILLLFSLFPHLTLLLFLVHEPLMGIGHGMSRVHGKVSAWVMFCLWDMHKWSLVCDKGWYFRMHQVFGSRVFASPIPPQLPLLICFKTMHGYPWQLQNVRLFSQKKKPPFPLLLSFFFFSPWIVFIPDLENQKSPLFKDLFP